MIDNIIKKLLLSIFTVFYITWFGGSIIKSQLAFSILEVDAEGKLYYIDTTPEVLFQTIQNYSLVSFFTEISFILAFICFIILSISISKYFKRYGWLFMSFMMILLSFLIHSFLIYFDIKLGIAIFTEGVSNYDHISVREYFFKRYDNVFYSGISMMSLLMNITAIVVLIFRPLKNDAEQADL